MHEIETNNSGIVFPEVINNFRVYNDVARVMGTTGEINLAEFQAMTAMISGAGILGEYNTSVIGMFQSIQQEIPFRMIDRDYFNMLNTGEQSKVVLRSSVQQRNRAAGNTLSTQAQRFVFRGHPTAAKMGTVKTGDLMNASITLELTYILVELGGVVMLELDKLNSVYKVAGKDMLKDIMNQC
ncbi:MAG: phage major tail tube protein [Lachnospiraceae bacterium]|nr:phage major tail tube protein [Lachnospiraceae bacterium]